MSTEKTVKHRRLFKSRKFSVLLEGQSKYVQAACCEIIDYMFANKIEVLKTADYLSLDNSLAREISSVADKLPPEFDLTELDLIDNYIEVFHKKQALKKTIVPAKSITPMGIIALMNELKIKHIKEVAVVSDDIVFSEELLRVSDKVIHYLHVNNDEYKKCRKLMLNGMIYNTSMKNKKYSGQLSMGESFFGKKKIKYPMIVICQNNAEDSLLLEHAESMLTDDGIIIYCVSPKVLTVTDYYLLRQDYIKKQKIQTMFELKNSSTPVFAAFIFSKKQNDSIRFISVENLIPSYRMPLNGESHSVEMSYSDFNEYKTDILSPSYFITRNTVKNDRSGSYIKLEEAVEISRGSYTSAAKIKDRYTDEKTGIRYLILSGIENGQIKDDIPNLTEISPLEEKYVAKKGDFVLSKVVNPIRFAEVAADKKMLVSVNLYIMRPKTEVMLPEYFKAYFESEEGQNQLLSIIRGDKSICVLEVKDLKNLMIPYPSMEEQKAFVEGLNKIKEEEKLLEEKLNELRTKRKVLLKNMIRK